MISSSNKTISSDRIEYIDIAKGIGIIMVVWAHAHGPLYSYIYQMHMPLFFLISGLLYNPQKPVKEFIIDKIKHLYIPFVFWNVLFYTVRSAVNHVAILSILKKDVEIVLTLAKDGTFFGATWFLGALFVVTIVYKIIDTTIKDSKYKEIFILIFFCAVALLGFQHTFRAYLSRTLILSLFFAVGAFIKKDQENFKNLNCWGMAVICSVMFILIGSFNSVGMASNEYKFPLLFVFGAFFASFALLYYCKVFDMIKLKFFLPIKNTLSFLGRRSLDILIWQFIGFFIVIILQMLLMNGEISWSEVFVNHTYFTGNGWWLIYTIVGIVFPLGLCALLRSGPWGKFLKKTHIV